MEKVCEVLNTLKEECEKVQRTGPHTVMFPFPHVSIPIIPFPFFPNTFHYLILSFLHVFPSQAHSYSLRLIPILSFLFPHRLIPVLSFLFPSQAHSHSFIPISLTGSFPFSPSYSLTGSFPFFHSSLCTCNI